MQLSLSMSTSADPDDPPPHFFGCSWAVGRHGGANGARTPPRLGVPASALCVLGLRHNDGLGARRHLSWRSCNRRRRRCYHHRRRPRRRASPLPPPSPSPAPSPTPSPAPSPALSPPSPPRLVDSGSALVLVRPRDGVPLLPLAAGVSGAAVLGLGALIYFAARRRQRRRAFNQFEDQTAPLPSPTIAPGIGLQAGVVVQPAVQMEMEVSKTLANTRV